MKRIGKVKFKKGAASFYVVAFSTLVLVIIAASFAAIVITEMTRSTNDDLAQSAYDSALAGVEDAKLAFYNYQSCIEQEATPVEPNGVSPLTCGEIVWYMQTDNQDCDMVAHILGRLGELESSEASGGILIQESSKNGENAMQQAYTCVKMQVNLSDYRSTLTEENPTRVVKAKLSGVAASEIQKVKISWYSRTDGSDLVYTNVNNPPTRVQFPALREGRAATPPTISFGFVQTASSFSLNDFDKVTDIASDRGTLFLVPTDNATMASGKKADNYIGAYNKTQKQNTIVSSDVIKSNDRSVKNLPFAVYCPRDLENGFTCSATIELPQVVNGVREDETFMFIVGIPYGQPSTDFALEFFCADGHTCGSKLGASGVPVDQAMLDSAQVSIDSTGRANDLYRRVEARLDSGDSFFPYPLYAIELLNSRISTNLLDKNLRVTKEYSESTYPDNLTTIMAR